jgi:ABC-type transporter Mla maintaining outer membrane lipid asymmetry ATPase subunit MlaF
MTVRTLNALRFDGISFWYEGQEPLLRDVEIDFKMDTVNILRGDRGGGRSTLLQILAGLQMPNHGIYEINGNNVMEMTFEDFLPYRLRIGYAFDLGGLISNRTLFDNMVLPLSYHKICSTEEAAKRVKAIFERFDLMKFKDLRPSHVSGSIRRITCLVRSLILDPEVLLLDDPTVGLSKETQKLFIEFIQETMKKGSLHTMFVSSYEESFISQFDHTDLYLEGAKLFVPTAEEKKAVNL